MLIPTEAIATAPAISSAPTSYSAPAGLSVQKPPDPSSRTPESTQHGSHWLSPGYSRTYDHTSTQKGWVSPTRGMLSLLPRIFRGHQHLPLGCQLRSPECSTRLRQSLCDLAGLFRTPQASLRDSPPLICVLTTRPTPHSERLICAPSDYISLRQLYAQQRTLNNPDPPASPQEAATSNFLFRAQYSATIPNHHPKYTIPCMCTIATHIVTFHTGKISLWY